MSPGKIITRHFKGTRTDCYTGIRSVVASDHYIAWVNVLDVDAAFMGRTLSAMLYRLSGYAILGVMGSPERGFNVPR